MILSVLPPSSGPVNKRRPGATQKARFLRRSETEPEFRLWSDLRNRLLNEYRFSRQVPLGPYVCDFVCRARRLIVELDGAQHADSLHDHKRTQWLNAKGYSLLRFWNREILTERRQVLDTILTALEGHYSARCEILRFYPANKTANGVSHEGDL